tara:strand:+ start:310 stop:552 length:243 start_codon:yes stop_codon:yes gene_type:complete
MSDKPNIKNHSSKEVNKAQDGFKKYCNDNKMSCKRDTPFNDAHSTGKGDIPRNVSQEFKNNYDEVFPNAFKPQWMKDLEE